MPHRCTMQRHAFTCVTARLTYIAVHSRRNARTRSSQTVRCASLVNIWRLRLVNVVTLVCAIPGVLQVTKDNLCSLYNDVSLR